MLFIKAYIGARESILPARSEGADPSGDGQEKVLGRVVIDHDTKAMDFMETTAREDRLLEAVRTLRQAGDRNPFNHVNTLTYEENPRARKLRKSLINEPASRFSMNIEKWPYTIDEHSSGRMTVHKRQMTKDYLAPFCPATMS